jgi:hypothetical protein
MDPSVTSESNKPSLSKSENGVSIARRPITRQTKVNSSRVFFLHMIEPLLEQRNDTEVVDAEIVFFTCVAWSNDVFLPKSTYLERHNRFGRAKHFCHIGNDMVVDDGD